MICFVVGSAVPEYAATFYRLYGDKWLSFKRTHVTIIPIFLMTRGRVSFKRTHVTTIQNGGECVTHYYTSSVEDCLASSTVSIYSRALRRSRLFYIFSPVLALQYRRLPKFLSLLSSTGGNNRSHHHLLLTWSFPPIGFVYCKVIKIYNLGSVHSYRDQESGSIAQM